MSVLLDSLVGVTLLLNMSKPEGIYLCADYRTTVSDTGVFIDDERVKFLTVHYPGDTKALIGFTGLAELKDGTPVGDWLRETLRGETEVFDASMAHLHSRLRRDFEKYRELLVVTVNVMDGDGIRRGFGGFTNQRPSGYISRDFGYVLEELPGPRGFAAGAPTAKAHAEKRFELIKRQLTVKPGRARDHMNMLATVNRRVAKADERRAKASGVDGARGTVSPFCHVAFIPAAGEDPRKYPPENRTYTRPGDGVEPPYAWPLLVNGVDLDYMTERMRAWTQCGGEFIFDPEEAQRRVNRRP